MGYTKAGVIIGEVDGSEYTGKLWELTEERQDMKSRAKAIAERA